jgi:hypothetical protein
MAQEGSRKRRMRGIDVTLATLALMVTVFFVAAGVFFYIHQSGQQAAFDEAVQKIANLKARGIPVDTNSLKTTYQSRTNPADAEAWMKILNYLGSQDFRNQIRGMEPFDRPLPTRTQTDQEDQLTMQRRVVQHNAELLETVHELASHRQPVQFDIGFDLSSSREYLSNLRLLIGLLTWEMHVAQADKDSSRVLASLTAQFDTMSIVQGEDLTIARQTFTAMKRDIFKNVRQLVENNLLSQPVLELVCANLKTLPSDIQRWQMTVQYQRAMTLPYLQRHVADSDTSSSPQEFTQATAQDWAHFLNYMDRYESISWSSWNTAKESLEAIDADLRNERNSELFSEERNWRNTQFLLSATPLNASISWTSHAKILAQNYSEQNQTIIACAIRLYQLKHGSFPNRLNQLMKVGIDPSKYLSIADLPFGYECQNNIAYLWGPVQGEDSEFPFEIETHPPQSSADPKLNMRINQALWVLQP